MNLYKLNFMSGFFYRKTLCDELNIHHRQVYKEVKDISSEGIITTKQGKKYRLKLEEIKE